MGKKRSGKPKASKTKPGERDMLTAWFAAARAHARSELAALLAAGCDVNARDGDGRTALHHSLAPYGGNPDLAMFLVAHGADVNAKDRDGLDPVTYGSSHVSSGAEANMIAHVGDRFEEHGWRGRRWRSSGNGGAGGTKKREPVTDLGKPEAPKERRRTKADFLGNWRVVAGPDAGARVSINEARISGDLRWARLSIDRIELDPQGRLRLDGDHAGELVHVSISLDESGRAHLSWSDGVTFPADLLLKR